MHSDPREIQMIVLDVDGVLTDGSIWIGQDGYELKRFHVRDGLGIKVWMKLGHQVAVISGRTSQAVTRRMEELGVALVYQGIKDKQKCLSELMDRSGLTLAQIAYVGDDWPDLGVLKRVGYPIAVADAEGPVRKIAAYTTHRKGGEGAVREAIDHLLKGKGKSGQESEEAGADGGSELPSSLAPGRGRVASEPEPIFRVID